MSTLEHIATNLASIEARIEAACARAGRARADVLLVAVSKTFEAAAIDAAVAAGITDVGENRVQEFRDKMPQIAARPRTHLIGHLQSNKAKDAAALFDCIQTIDSRELATRLGRHAPAGKRLEVLVQVNVGDEPQKNGVAIDDAIPLARAIRDDGAVNFAGFMTIPPIASEETTRGYFRAMRRVAEEAASLFGMSRVELSMGMSEDFELAIDEGATMIRLGRAIFGQRE